MVFVLRCTCKKFMYVVKIFGMWCRMQRRLYIFPVPNRQMITLMPYIRAYVPQNARINTDGYGGYARLARGWRHAVVIHK